MLCGHRDYGVNLERVKVKRRQINLRLSENEEMRIRAAASKLGMTVTEYILQCSVYSREDECLSTEGGNTNSGVVPEGCSSVAPLRIGGIPPISHELLREYYKELRNQSVELSRLRDAAAMVGRQTRSLAHQDLCRRLICMCDRIEPAMLDALRSVASLVGTCHPDRS